MEMTLEDFLKETKELCDGATEGPWESFGSRFDWRLENNKGCVIARSELEFGNTTDFMADARTAIPILLEMVEILKKQVWCSHNQHDCNEIDKELNQIIQKHRGENHTKPNQVEVVENVKKEKCPSCGSETFMVARDFWATRHCSCCATWKPQKESE